MKPDREDVLSCVAALVLAMIAIGALHVSEHAFARTAYDASVSLLARVSGDLKT